MQVILLSVNRLGWKCLQQLKQYTPDLSLAPCIPLALSLSLSLSPSLFLSHPLSLSPSLSLSLSSGDVDLNYPDFANLTIFLSMTTSVRIYSESPLELFWSLGSPLGGSRFESQFKTWESFSTFAAYNFLAKKTLHPVILIILAIKNTGSQIIKFKQLLSGLIYLNQYFTVKSY